jgi:hypothetical protein
MPNLIQLRTLQVKMLILPKGHVAEIKKDRDFPKTEVSIFFADLTPGKIALIMISMNTKKRTWEKVRFQSV